MRLLVTGGAGFIGSNFVHYVLDTHPDDEVVTLDKLTYAGSRENLAGVLDHPRHRFVEGDICDPTIVSDLVAGVDAVLNFAAESHVDRSIESAKAFVRTNVEGTQTLLEAAVEADIDRFLQVSTDEVYGHTLEGNFSETDSLNPRNPYAATKASADLLVRSYGTTYGLPVIVTRSCNNFGPRQHHEKLVPKLVRRALAGEELPIYGTGANVREWIDVTDNCRAIYTALTEGELGEIYNIGTGDERTNLEVARLVLDAAGGSEDQITFVEDRAGHDLRYAVDASKIRDLGWAPEGTLEEWLTRAVAQR
ncbi:dTDP-D-glucose 4,6-dehydratase [Halapricum desulfuricans]|uniref:dTDP-D-glucose 4,6-dehydratase n=1 Tax=Halapricum desulfuricans TaxID=2841257 RepID=A0A897NK41_9EURY|nr:dTDP-glucose 4,6-dehydratase [Halapricum desulfuricans]QSG11323.1 dTDP-D-glucose 4,6-dehydratase [Halapricum desulfuricans]